MKFINAKEGLPNAGSKTYTVHYFDEKGNMTIRSGGTKAWRNNNPGNMKYNAQEYRRMLLSIYKFDANKRINDLIAKEFNQLREAIERIEGWDVGKEDFIEKWYISGVHKKHGVIIEYLVDKKGRSSWITKEKALKLALEGRLHATIVHLKNGTIYLRPEYGNQPFTRVA